MDASSATSGDDIAQKSAAGSSTPPPAASQNAPDPAAASDAAHHAMFPAAALPVDPVASAYQPHRAVAAAISMTWSLLFAGGFLASGAASSLFAAMHGGTSYLRLLWMVPLYALVYFAAAALWGYPIELWFGYMEERQFGLAKDGIRAWSRDWLIGVAQHGLMFILGSSMLMALQVWLGHAWLPVAAAVLLVIFLLSTYLAADLLPRGIFQFEPVNEQTRARLTALVPQACREHLPLPPLISFIAPSLREFSGGLIGLGRRRAILLSRPTILLASDAVMRFVLVRELARMRYHHLLISALVGWAWLVMGLTLCWQIVPADALGLPPCIAWLGLLLSSWMVLGQPTLAFLSRRLEYQADRFYLRNGGSVEEMQQALGDLSRRNLIKTEGLRRRETMFHPLPSVWNRLHRAAAMQRDQLGTPKGDV